MRGSNWKVDVLLTGSWRGATSVLLSNGRQRIVVDTGLPRGAYRLVSALRARGLAPEDVTGLINTHFHVDHVLNNSLFPQCAIYATQESHDWCRSLYSDLVDDAKWEQMILRYYPETFQYERARKHMQKSRKIALRWWDPARLGDRSRFRGAETHPLPDNLEPLVTSGHVPGNLSVIVHRASEPTVITGDALLSRNHDEKVLTMIPHSKAQSARDRARILALKGRILPGHDREFRIGVTTPGDAMGIPSGGGA